VPPSLGTPGPATLTGATVAVVAGAAVLVALVATVLPALRAARSATVTALDAPARPPRRSGRLIAVSARLPVSLLLGLRLIGRRPARAMLAVVSTAVTATGLVTILTSAAMNGGGLHNPRAERLAQVTGTITVMLLMLAAVNTIFLTWATVADGRQASALSRAFGATPAQITAGLSAAQVVPALIGAVAGVPAGLLLYRLMTQTSPVVPSASRIALVVGGAVLAVAACTAVSAGFGARRPGAEVLNAS
jgi:ABC-type antimicrobial peptide transport system permease subunit